MEGSPGTMTRFAPRSSSGRLGNMLPVELIVLVLMYTLDTMDEFGRRDLLNILITSTQLREIGFGFKSLWTTLSFNSISFGRTSTGEFLDHWFNIARAPLSIRINCYTVNHALYPKGYFDHAVNETKLNINNTLENLARNGRLRSLEFDDPTNGFWPSLNSGLHNGNYCFPGVIKTHPGTRLRLEALQSLTITSELMISQELGGHGGYSGFWDQFPGLRTLTMYIAPVIDGTHLPVYDYEDSPTVLRWVTTLTVILNRREAFFLSYLSCPALKELIVRCDPDPVRDTFDLPPNTESGDYGVIPDMSDIALYIFLSRCVMPLRAAYFLGDDNTISNSYSRVMPQRPASSTCTPA